MASSEKAVVNQRTAAQLALVLAVCACGFVAGSWWHAKVTLEAPAGPEVAPIAIAPPVRAPAAVAPEAPAPVADRPSIAQCAEVETKLVARSRELAAVQAELQELKERRVVREGAPIPMASAPQEPRFEPNALRTAVADAFVQEKVPGRVDGLDCTEWPCIIYGRIRGTEDEMEKLEGAKALAAYEHDVLTVLLWVVTDEAAHAAPLPILPGRPEQSLFAFAFYPRGLARPVAENVDRRLRSRTAELWNTMSPADETGR